MDTPKPEQLWQIADRHRKTGRPPVFESPDAMWQAALAYFRWSDENPLYAYKTYCQQGEIITAPEPRMRAYTIGGFRLHSGICQQTWNNYQANPEFFEVTKKIEEAIRTQKFTGAAADLLNANIIARDLGLADKKDLSSSDGTMSPQKELSDDDLLAALERYGIKPNQ